MQKCLHLSGRHAAQYELSSAKSLIARRMPVQGGGWRMLKSKGREPVHVAQESQRKRQHSCTSSCRQPFCTPVLGKRQQPARRRLDRRQRQDITQHRHSSGQRQRCRQEIREEQQHAVELRRHAGDWPAHKDEQEAEGKRPSPLVVPPFCKEPPACHGADGGSHPAEEEYLPEVTRGRSVGYETRARSENKRRGRRKKEGVG